MIKALRVRGVMVAKYAVEKFVAKGRHVRIAVRGRNLSKYVTVGDAVNDVPVSDPFDHPEFGPEG
jgi:hypothetical protein